MTHSGWLFQLFSAGRGLEPCSQLRAADGPGRTRTAAVCAAGEALLGRSTARVMAFDSIPRKMFLILREQNRESLPPAQLVAAAEHSTCLCVLDVAFRVSARACHRGTGKAVK